MKSKETTETISLLYICCEIKELLFAEPCDPENVEVYRVVDRALGISERVITDASVKCWASCPTDRNATCCSHFSISIPSAETAAAQFEVLSTFLPNLPGLLTQITENKNVADIVSTPFVSPMMRRRNIHSLLTLAAEPSEPDVGAAVRLRGRPQKHSPGFVQAAPFRKERAAGVVPAFT